MWSVSEVFIRGTGYRKGLTEVGHLMPFSTGCVWVWGVRNMTCGEGADIPQHPCRCLQADFHAAWLGTDTHSLLPWQRSAAYIAGAQIYPFSRPVLGLGPGCPTRLQGTGGRHGEERGGLGLYPVAHRVPIKGCALAPQHLQNLTTSTSQPGVHPSSYPIPLVHSVPSVQRGQPLQALTTCLTPAVTTTLLQSPP